MITREELNFNPITGKYEHIVHGSWEDTAKANYERRKEIGRGITLKSEAKELCEIPIRLIAIDPLVRMFFDHPDDKSLRQKVFEKYPHLRTSTDGPSENRIFTGGASNET